MTSAYPISGFVLAGGASSRMGEDKGLLQFEGRTLLERCLSLMKPLCEDCAVIGPPSRYASLDPGVEIVEDAVGPCGPLGGILTGLRRTRHSYSLLMACDLPLMTPKFLHYLIGAALAEKPDIVVPVDQSGEYEPLCAIYSRECLPVVEESIASGKFKVSDFYKSVKKLRVVGTGEIRRFSPDFRIFTNVNTPEELAAVRDTRGETA